MSEELNIQTAEKQPMDVENIPVNIPPEVASSAQQFFDGLTKKYGRTIVSDLPVGATEAGSDGIGIKPHKLRLLTAHDRDANHFMIESFENGSTRASISSSLISARTDHQFGPLDSFTFRPDGTVTYDGKKNSDDPENGANPEDIFERFVKQYKEAEKQVIPRRKRATNYTRRLMNGTIFKQA